MCTPRLLALVFLFLGLVSTTVLVFELPPIQGPDEGAHYVRADEISLGELFSHRLSADQAGGLTHIGVIDAIKRFYPILTDGRRVKQDDFEPIGWGKKVLWSFPNTALYPPFCYIPAAISIAAGRAFQFDVLQTEKIARLSLGLSSVLIATLAITLAGSSSYWLFAILLLPSSLNLMSVVTQDGILLSSAALAASLTFRLQKPSTFWRTEFIILCLLLSNLGMCRPPYAVLGLLPLLTNVQQRSRNKGCAFVFAAVTGWMLIARNHIYVDVDPTHKANLAQQILFLATNSNRIMSIVLNTIKLHFVTDYSGYFISTFQPPRWFVALAWSNLLCACLMSRPSKSLMSASRTRCIWSLIFVSAFAVFAIQYLTWTPVGAGSVNGVLGRYFLPLAVMGAATFANFDASKTDRRSTLLSAIVLLFPVVSIGVTIDFIVKRYYVGS